MVCVLQAGFERAEQQLARAFAPSPAHDGSGAAPVAAPAAAASVVPPQPTTSLTRAKLLAQYNKIGAATLSEPAGYAAALLEVPSLEELCWMVYSGE